MANSFKEAVRHRRSYYSIGKDVNVSNHDIEEIVKFALLNVPSAFNSQSARVVLLFDDNHTKLWDIVKNNLRKIVPAQAFEATSDKIDTFSAGYGTMLYFEDQAVVEALQAQFPTYAENFPKWSLQSSGMLQFTIWTMLEDAGFGASLQHYNPLIDIDVHSEWNIPKNWILIAQMPFGNPVAKPGAKEFLPIEDRMMTFK